MPLTPFPRPFVSLRLSLPWCGAAAPGLVIDPAAFAPDASVTTARRICSGYGMNISPQRKVDLGDHTNPMRDARVDFAIRVPYQSRVWRSVRSGVVYVVLERQAE